MITCLSLGGVSPGRSLAWWVNLSLSRTPSPTAVLAQPPWVLFAEFREQAQYPLVSFQKGVLSTTPQKGAQTGTWPSHVDGRTQKQRWLLLFSLLQHRAWTQVLMRADKCGTAEHSGSQVQKLLWPGHLQCPNRAIPGSETCPS